MDKLVFLLIVGFTALLLAGGVFLPSPIEIDPVVVTHPPQLAATEIKPPSYYEEPVASESVAEPAQIAEEETATSSHPILPLSIAYDVPFTSQAPFGNWADDRQQNGCEEASALMAMLWVEGKTVTPKEAEEMIIAISDYEQERYGEFHETSAEDTTKWIFNDYFTYENVEARYDPTAEDIKRELAAGNLVVSYVNGQKLKNPYYTPPGPLDHVLVVTGYDDVTGEFITNDPGTRRGAGFRYNQEIFVNALREYPTGYHVPVAPEDERGAVIVVRPKT